MHPAADCRSGLVQSRSTMVLAETVADMVLRMIARQLTGLTFESGCRGKNSFGGMGATLVDSLDTLWLLGLKDAFQRARDWIASSLRFDMCAAAEVAQAVPLPDILCAQQTREWVEAMCDPLQLAGPATL